MPHPVSQKQRSPLLLLLFTLAAFSLALLPSRVFADSVTIDDQANVLDTSQVQAEAAKLSYPIFIYTTKTFSGDQDALNQATRQRLPDQNSIAIGIDVTQRHLSIQSGTSVPLSDSQASDALNAFRSNFNNGDYTGATIAAIDSLLNALDSGNTGNSGITFAIVSLAIIGGFLVLLVIVGIISTRNPRNYDDDDWRRPGGGWRNRTIYTFGGGFGSSNFGGGAGGSTGGGAGGSF